MKAYCDLYNEILGTPDFILYAIDTDSSVKECMEWLNLFEKYHDRKIIFFSSARTYM